MLDYIYELSRASITESWLANECNSLLNISKVVACATKFALNKSTDSCTTTYKLGFQCSHLTFNLRNFKCSTFLLHARCYGLRLFPSLSIHALAFLIHQLVLLVPLTVTDALSDSELRLD